MGVIVRTAGVGRSSEELNWDLSYLPQLGKQSCGKHRANTVITVPREQRGTARRQRQFTPRYWRGSDRGEAAFQEASAFIAQVMPITLTKLRRTTTQFRYLAGIKSKARSKPPTSIRLSAIRR